MVVGMSNPKTIVFFVAFLPQFTDPGAGHVGLQVALLGLLFAVLAVASDSVWAMAAGRARDWFARRPERLDAMGAVGGVMMIGLGATLAAAGLTPAARAHSGRRSSLGQSTITRAPPPSASVDRDVAAVGAGQAADDVHAQAGAAAGAVLPELGEDAAAHLLGDALALVVDADAHARHVGRLGRPGQRHASPGPRRGAPRSRRGW